MGNVLENHQGGRCVNLQHAGDESRGVEIAQKAGRAAVDPEDVLERKDDISVIVGKRSLAEAIRSYQETSNPPFMQKPRQKIRSGAMNACNEIRWATPATSGRFDKSRHEKQPLPTNQRLDQPSRPGMIESREDNCKGEKAGENSRQKKEKRDLNKEINVFPMRFPTKADKRRTKTRGKKFQKSCD